ncbi:MAG: Hint domain-containing protein [Rhodospirillales bacterium]|nr:Hint domain-containing protein [Rhodospirillales bacterium]
MATNEYLLSFTDAAGDSFSATITTNGGTSSTQITAVSGTDQMAVYGSPGTFQSGSVSSLSNYAGSDETLYPTQHDTLDGYTSYIDGSGVSFTDSNGNRIQIYATGNGQYLTWIQNAAGQFIARNTTVTSFSVTPICFMSGTLIRTPEGEVAVESLRAGDLVLTASGAAKPVRWLGRSDISARFADPLRAAPIRITAGALGKNLPARDLRVSSAHAVFIGNMLVQAGALVNGTTIVRERIEADFSFYHVELETHELLISEGLASESFVDNIDRMHFSNWAERRCPETPIEEMPFPRVRSARQLPAAIRSLVAVPAAA